METYWVCMAPKWSVPAEPCTARGKGTAAAEKHTKTTEHPTFQTMHEHLADRLAGSTV
jgi:hypothetical protein